MVRGYTDRDGTFHPFNQYQKKGTRKSRDKSDKEQGVLIRKARGKTIKGKKSEIYGVITVEQAKEENEKIDAKYEFYKSKQSSIKQKLAELEEATAVKRGKLERQEYDAEKEFNKYIQYHPHWHYLKPKYPAEEDIVPRITKVGNYLNYDDISKSGTVYFVDGKWMKITTYFRSDESGSPTDEAYLKTEEVVVT